MTFVDLLIILLVHWIADFILQTDAQAKAKSKSNVALLEHVSVYSMTWFIVGIFIGVSTTAIGSYIPAANVLYFTAITFCSHLVTDYYTSRLNSKLWSKGDSHNFFVSVGFDQVLHYVQLILCYQYFLK